MKYDVYQQRVLARASHRWHQDRLTKGELLYALVEFIKAGNRLDRVKKSLMYGRQYEGYASDPYYGEHSLSAGPVGNPLERDQILIHAMLGIATESVEMIEAVHAFFNSGEDFDLTNLQEEFGDAEWYRALGLYALGQTHEANLEQNDAKLEARFGSTFTEEAANNRNLDLERKTLEG